MALLFILVCLVALLLSRLIQAAGHWTQHGASAIQLNIGYNTVLCLFGDISKNPSANNAYTICVGISLHLTVLPQFVQNLIP